MSTIESVSNETRIFAPPREFVAQANVKQADFDALNAAAAARFRGLLGASSRATKCSWHKPFTQDARRIERAVLQVVRRRRAQRLVQLPRPQSRERQRRARSRSSSRPTTAPSPSVTYQRAAITASAGFANALKSPRHQEGRPRARSTCRCRSRASSRCRRARASARRIRSCSAASRPSRCRSASSTPARSRSITADEQVRGGKHLPLKTIVDEALAHGRLREQSET